MSASSFNQLPHRRPKPWDRKLRSEFEDVPSTSTDERIWYGPWDTAVHRLFKDADGFQIAPQRLKAFRRGEPEWTLYYLIKQGGITVCVVKIKQYSDLKRPQGRIDAYGQVADLLKELVTDDHPTPVIYGLSVIGEQFLIMSIDTETGTVTPALKEKCPLAQVAPSDYWRNQVLKRSGYRRLARMVSNIKDMCADFPPQVPDDIPVTSEEDSDTSSQ